MKRHEWTTQQLAQLVPGAKVTQPEQPGVNGERVLTVIKLIQDSAYAGGWAVNHLADSRGGLAVAVLDPESVVSPYVCHEVCGHPVNYRGGQEQAKTCKVCPSG